MKTARLEDHASGRYRKNLAIEGSRAALGITRPRILIHSEEVSVDEQRWQQIVIPPGNEYHVWELFHENSKISRYSDSLSDEQVMARMQQFHETLPFVGYPIVELPRSFTPMRLSLKKP